jgi:hypothetical protein
LTGLPVGQLDEQGVYPPGTVNRRVLDRLAELAELRRKFSEQALKNATADD